MKGPCVAAEEFEMKCAGCHRDARPGTEFCERHMGRHRRRRFELTEMEAAELALAVWVAILIIFLLSAVFGRHG